MADPSLSEELNKLRESTEKAYADHDFDRMSTTWATDCKFMEPGKPIQTGREVIITSAEGMWKNGIRRMSMEIENAVSTGPGWAFAYGNANFSLEDGTTTPRVTFLTIYERDADGQFRIKMDCSNIIQ